MALRQIRADRKFDHNVVRSFVALITTRQEAESWSDEKLKAFERLCIEFVNYGNHVTLEDIQEFKAMR